MPSARWRRSTTTETNTWTSFSLISDISVCSVSFIIQQVVPTKQSDWNFDRALISMTACLTHYSKYYSAKSVYSSPWQHCNCQSWSRKRWKNTLQNGSVCCSFWFICFNVCPRRTATGPGWELEINMREWVISKRHATRVSRKMIRVMEKQMYQWQQRWGVCSECWLAESFPPPQQLHLQKTTIAQQDAGEFTEKLTKFDILPPGLK